jgi:hypothetical protein
MTSAADVVLMDGLRDRSFAGLFAYSSNVPMKIFAGNEPSVPVSVLIDALDTLQGGQASKGGAAQMHGAASAHIHHCQADCMLEHSTCMMTAGVGGAQSCVAITQACNSNCAAD